MATDASAVVRYFTRFTEEAFAALIGIIFVYKALEKLFSKCIGNNYWMNRNKLKESASNVRENDETAEAESTLQIAESNQSSALSSPTQSIESRLKLQRINSMPTRSPLVNAPIFSPFSSNIYFRNMFSRVKFNTSLE